MQVYTWGALDPGAGVNGQQLDASETMQHVLEEHGGTAPITLMQPFRSSSRAQAKRLVAIWDAAGRMRVQRDNGTIRFQAATNHTHLASNAIGAMVVSLTPTHASVQLQTLRSPPRAHVCKLLNGSRLIAAVFDPARQSRAYAVNDRAQLLTMMVPHEHRTTTCKVLKVRPLPMLLPEDSPSNESWSREACEPGTTSTDSSLPGSDSISSSDHKSGSTIGQSEPGGTTSSCNGEPKAGGSNKDSGCEEIKTNGAGVAEGGGVQDEKQQGLTGVGVKGEGGQCDSKPTLIQGPVLLASLRGYLIMSGPRGVTVFNVSSLHLPPQEVITEPAASLAGLFGASIEVPPPGSATNFTNSPVHLLATSPNGGVLAVGLGSAKQGIVAMFESSMHVPPALSASKSVSNRAPWLQPFVIGVAALLSLLFFKLRSRSSSMGPMGLTPGGLAARRGKERLEGGLFAGHSWRTLLVDRPVIKGD
ncbi:hypothetical protein DUNSADRAFT_13232 [Dunaliella salina]|uniref:Uncharacterized protein n=1 Tax=Dunaliella salina TaxID=3046 RepID=A0ABQ7H3B5_DUNSA|nr:hypothetical protein DUNSADRAFT_13232 [Dunaliella salina]|eukprot:KAF5841364.1 hypothetical protein DUNSADRAFT_13232 [Dunaliella salina]